MRSSLLYREITGLILICHLLLETFTFFFFLTTSVGLLSSDGGCVGTDYMLRSTILNFWSYLPWEDNASFDDSVSEVTDTASQAPLTQVKTMNENFHGRSEGHHSGDGPQPVLPPVLPPTLAPSWPPPNHQHTSACASQRSPDCLGGGLAPAQVRSGRARTGRPTTTTLGGSFLDNEAISTPRTFKQCLRKNQDNNICLTKVCCWFVRLLVPAGVCPGSV